MMKIKRIDEIEINYETLCKATLLLFICFLYAFYEERIYIEILYVILFSFYFVYRRKSLTVYALWSLLVIGIAAMSIFWSSAPSESILMTRKLVEIALIGNLLIAFIDRREKIMFFYKAFVVAGIVLIIRLLLTFPISMWGTERLGNNFFNANEIGLYLAISSIFAYQLSRYRHKSIYLVFILIFFVVIGLTGSRKAILFLFVGISALLYFNSKSVSKKITSFILILGISVIGYKIIMNVPEFYEVLGIRLEKMINGILGEGNTDTSTMLRLSMIDTGINLFINKPNLGYGISTYSTISGFGMYSHNNYIELLVGIGIVGTLVFYSIYVYLIIRLFKFKKRVYSNPLLVGIVMLAMLEYGLVSYYNEVFQILIAVSVASLKIK